MDIRREAEMPPTLNPCFIVLWSFLPVRLPFESSLTVAETPHLGPLLELDELGARMASQPGRRCSLTVADHQPLHSGYSGPVPDPVRILCAMIADLPGVSAVLPTQRSCP